MYYLRRLQSIPRNKAAMICIAAPIRKALKLNTHDLIIEELDEAQNRIILTKANIERQSQDGNI
jgi:bifunctional DNA-binding transcriptional regulator/antitoxin component of YhaV-PrlF toxin-antitoxin module